ncbi:tryptophan 2,3-dioxygenase family protein, partial [Yersinia alsatica]
IGHGDNDYEKYMNTEFLLSLQRSSDEWIHRDELLFQIIHQSTELWLKLSNEELKEAIKLLEEHSLSHATALIQRASQCIRSITEQLEILTHMTPYDFFRIRPILGNGSGLESPGWKNVNTIGREMAKTINNYLDETETDLIKVYTQQTHSEIFNLCEALISWDEWVSLWRTRHYKVAVRTIGHKTVGTKGTPVDKLAQLIGHKYFPRLWQLRSELVEEY